MFVRLQRLLNSEKPDHIEAEAIDRAITEACELGEKACRKRRREYWSIELHEVKRELAIWCILKSWRRRGIKLDCLLKRSKELGIPISKDVSEKDTKETITELRQKLREIHKKSKKYREEMLTNLANFSEDIDDTKRAHYLRQMKKAERKNRVYSLLKFKRGKSLNSGGID